MMLQFAKCDDNSWPQDWCCEIPPRNYTPPVNISCGMRSAASTSTGFIPRWTTPGN